MGKISVVILTKNEESNINECLSRLKWVDEVVIVDDYSTDSTAKIARSFNAKIFKRHLDNDFSSQRNFGLSKTSGEWVLFIDADERVSSSLAKEIQKKVQNTKANGFKVKRQDIFMGKEMIGGEWGNNYLIRLVRRKRGKWERAVHETLIINGEVMVLSSPLLHSPAKTLGESIQKINYYSLLHAKSNISEGKSVNLIKIVFWPFAKFILNFVFKRGYKDGVYGLVFSILMSFHSYLSWSKQWELQREQ